ncbi:MAG: BCD family MFS transporter [Chloroherpetonaceae bacterium]
MLNQLSRQSQFERQRIDLPTGTLASHTSLTEHSAQTPESKLEQLSREIPLPRVLQICLLQLSTATLFVLLNSTLNRVMVVELNISATLVGVLIGFHNILAFVRPMIGHYSDTHLRFGLRRTPNIIVGNLLAVSGVVLSVYGALAFEENFALGITLLLIAFTLYGVGVNFVGTMFYALLADSAGEKHKAKAVTVGWFVLILGTIVASGFIGKYLENFSMERLVSLFWAGAGVSIFFTWLAVFGTEKRFAREHEIVKNEKHTLHLSDALKRLVANPTVYAFFIFMFVTVVAIQGQDVILEPFGAELFGMSVSQTTELTRIWGTGTMLGIVTLGLFFVNRIGKKRTTYLGCFVSALGFLAISLSPMIDILTFKGGVFLLGVGNGALTVGSLTIMMDMTTRENAGLFMGLWGMGQAIANFVANATGGAIRDIALWITQNHYAGYATAFAIEIIGLFAAIMILRGIDIQEFQSKTQHTLSSVVSQAD